MLWRRLRAGAVVHPILFPITKKRLDVGGAGYLEKQMAGQSRSDGRCDPGQSSFWKSVRAAGRTLILLVIAVALQASRSTALSPMSEVRRVPIINDLGIISSPGLADSAQSIPLVAEAANAPVFVMDHVDLGAGALGGDLVNWVDDGRVAAEMAVRVLNGERPQDIPIITSNHAYMFDWRALKRWGIDEKNLPGCIVLNRLPSFWESYKWYVVSAIFILLLQTVAILGLLWQRERRRKTEAELRRSEEKSSKSFRQSPLAISITSTNEGRYIDVNDAFERQTGWMRNEVIGRSSPDGLWADSNQRLLFIKQLLAEGNVRDVEVSFAERMVRFAQPSVQLS